MADRGHQLAGDARAGGIDAVLEVDIACGHMEIGARRRAGARPEGRVGFAAMDPRESDVHWPGVDESEGAGRCRTQ